MTRQLSMTEGKIGPALLNFAVPVLMSGFLQALYGAVDLLVVGRYDSSAAVSAVATGSQMMQTITGAVLGLSMGGTVLIGHAIGEKEPEKAARAVGTLAVLFAVIAAVCTAFMTLATGWVTGLLHTPREAFTYAKQYIFICSSGIPVIIGYNAVSSIFRGIGDSKTPMYLVAAACLVNVVLDFLLVGVFHMGAAGAALATIAAQSLSFFLSLFIIARRGFPFDFGRQHFKPDSHAMKRILLVGTPLAVQDALVNISFLIITVIVNTMGFAMLPPSAVASAVATMTAQNMGANKPERAWGALKCGIGYSLIFGTAVCIYSQFWPQTLTGIFSGDPQVIAAAAQYLRSYALDCVLVCFVFCINSYFSGSGKSVITFAHSMAATFGVRIPMSYLISRYATGTLYYMGLAAPAASVLSIMICGVILAKQQRRGNGRAKPRP